MCGIHDVLIPLLDDKGDANAIGDRNGGGQCTMDMQQHTYCGVFHCDNDAEQHKEEHCTVDACHAIQRDAYDAHDDAQA